MVPKDISSCDGLGLVGGYGQLNCYVFLYLVPSSRAKHPGLLFDVLTGRQVCLESAELPLQLVLLSCINIKTYKGRAEETHQLNRQ